jgi:hypothetical protein
MEQLAEQVGMFRLRDEDRAALLMAPLSMTRAQQKQRSLDPDKIVVESTGVLTSTSKKDGSA